MMMKLSKTTVLAWLGGSCLIMGLAQAASPTRGNPESYQYGMKPYPAAPSGYTRLSIHLPKLADEDAAVLRFRAGKSMTVDCNQQHLDGRWQQQTAQGWGFDYYTLSSSGQVVSTRMACPPDSSRQAFVPAGGAQDLRYNSRVPVVVYVPTGYQVHYSVLMPKYQGVAAPE
ncbi:MAG TPA: ecotin family protein [Thiolinea sp.]|nr:ecotin family protein [Thiolinea sp.]